MTLSELYLLIGLPDGVIAQLNEYEENRTCEIPPTPSLERSTGCHC